MCPTPDDLPPTTTAATTDAFGAWRYWMPLVAATPPQPPPQPPPTAIPYCALCGCDVRGGNMFVHRVGAGHRVNELVRREVGEARRRRAAGGLDEHAFLTALHAAVLGVCRRPAPPPPGEPPAAAPGAAPVDE